MIMIDQKPKPKRDWPWALLLVFIMFVIASAESIVELIIF